MKATIVILFVLFILGMYSAVQHEITTSKQLEIQSEAIRRLKQKDVNNQAIFNDLINLPLECRTEIKQVIELNRSKFTYWSCLNKDKTYAEK
jgi:anionic cell wall polymer biosynthesis LytR-Cps2A-Psr (LCP) family protein